MTRFLSTQTVAHRFYDYMTGMIVVMHWKSIIKSLWLWGYEWLCPPISYYCPLP